MMNEREYRELRDKLIQEQQEKEDRRDSLNRDLRDAMLDRERAEKTEDFLGMAKAQQRIEEAKQELRKLRYNPEA